MPSVTLLSLLVGGLLSLIVGLRNDEFVWISPLITILDSLLLGLAVLISIYFTRAMVPYRAHAALIYLLSFGVMLGAGVLSAVVIFLLSPSSFFYSDNRTITYLLINLLFFITINIIVNGHILFMQTVRESVKALNEEKILKSRMELKLLASKINPHFLFNSLSLVLSLLKKPDKAEAALINLSELLRYQLEFSDAPMVSLESELTAVEKYLAIQQMRFGNKLTYRIESQMEGEIPPLLIQPLVENCIKHNIDRTDHLHIDLEIKGVDRRLQIRVFDNQARLKPEMLEKGLGLSVDRKSVV